MTKSSKSTDSLLKALSQIDRPEIFACSAEHPFVMPGLDIDGLGLIGFPLAKLQAQAIIQQCYQAPYGKGTETIVDTNVRKVWELDPKNFRLLNPEWDKAMSSMLTEIQNGLGLEKCKLSAQLYKLLIYEKGGFFLPHRDGEKMDGMVATLVITLPSIHKGGELLVSHEGHTEVFNMSGAASGMSLNYTAFYADCLHEVKPLLSGYRMCLIYNCKLEKQHKSLPSITAPSYHKNIDDLVATLERWNKEGTPSKLAITLEHQYSQKSLSLDLLKGVDRARAEVLFEAAHRAQCEAYLGLLTFWQSGDAEGAYDWDDDYYGRGNTEGPHEMGEVYDESLTVEHWSDREGQQLSLGTIKFSEQEIVSDSPMADWEADEEDFEGYTGNAGMTLERWYRRAVIAIWSCAQHESTLCDAGTLAALGGFDLAFKKWKAAKKSLAEPLRNKCFAFAEAIIQKWEFKNHGESHSASLESRFLNQLCTLDALTLVQRFFSEVLPKMSKTEVEASVWSYFHKKGWDNIHTELCTLFEHTDPITMARNLTLLEQLSQIQDNKELQKCCQRGLEFIFKALVQIDAEPRRSWSSSNRNSQLYCGKVISISLLLDSDKVLREFIKHTQAQSQHYSLSNVIVPALSELKKQLLSLPKPPAVFKTWLENLEATLQKSLGSMPEAPKDWTRSGLKCDCRDCAVVNNFLGDGQKDKLLLPLSNVRRKHLHQSITSSGADLLHASSRSRSTETLVLTKTNNTYEKLKALFDRDHKNCVEVKNILKKLK